MNTTGLSMGKLTSIFITLILSGCSSPQHFNDLAQKEEHNSIDVIPYLKLKKGDTIADLGAGGGYFSYRLSQAVGEKGKVYAVEISKESVDYIRKKAKEKGLSNIEVVLAEYDNSKLDKNSIDLVFIRNAYHDFQNRVEYFSQLRSVLKQNGRLAVIDYDPQKLGFFRKFFGHAINEDNIKEELKKAGYLLAESIPLLKYQSFNIFRPAGR